MVPLAACDCQCLSLLQPAALVMVLVLMQTQHKSWQAPRLAIPLPSTPALLLLDSCSQCSLLYIGTPAHRQLPATVADTTFICCQRKLSARSSDQPSGLQLPSSRRSFKVALSFEFGETTGFGESRCFPLDLGYLFK